MEELVLDLPAPAFRGTPTESVEPNVEAPLGKPRPNILVPEGTVKWRLSEGRARLRRRRYAILGLPTLGSGWGLGVAAVGVACAAAVAVVVASSGAEVAAAGGQAADPMAALA